MVTATLTTKGQVTIPKSVRDSLNLHAGDRIAFIIHGDSEATIKPITRSVDDVFGRLHTTAQQSKTVEEMNEALAGRFKDRAQ